MHGRSSRRNSIVVWAGVASIWVVGWPVVYYLGLSGVALFLAALVALQLFYFRDPLRRNWRRDARLLLFGIFRVLVLAGLFVGLMVSDAGWPSAILLAAAAWVVLAAVTLFRNEGVYYGRPISPRAKRLMVLGEASGVAALAILALVDVGDLWWFVALLLLLASGASFWTSGKGSSLNPRPRPPTAA